MGHLPEGVGARVPGGKAGPPHQARAQQRVAGQGGQLAGERGEGALPPLPLLDQAGPQGGGHPLLLQHRQGGTLSRSGQGVTGREAVSGISANRFAPGSNAFNGLKK